MREAGDMLGVYGEYAFCPHAFMLKIEGRFSFGNVDYIVPNSPEHADDIRDYVIEPRLLFGWNFRISEEAYLTPIAGFGYRYLYDGMGGKMSVWGWPYYDRKSHYLYSPIGLEGMAHVGGGWLLGESGEYDHFWRGWQFSQYGDTGPFVTNIQSEGWGARGSLRFIKRLGRVDLVVEPFLRYWNISQSKVDEIYAPEPPNKSTEWGTRLGVRF